MAEFEVFDVYCCEGDGGLSAAVADEVSTVAEEVMVGGGKFFVTERAFNELGAETEVVEEFKFESLKD